MYSAVKTGIFVPIVSSTINAFVPAVSFAAPGLNNERWGFTATKMRRLRNLNSNAKSHRTALSFGRPDIGSYLRETFSMETETADGIDESKYSKTMDVSTGWR